MFPRILLRSRYDFLHIHFTFPTLVVSISFPVYEVRFRHGHTISVVFFLMTWIPTLLLLSSPLIAYSPSF